MNNGKIKKLYKNTMLIIVVALITFVLTSMFLYNKLGTSSFISNIGNNKINSELIRKIYSIKAI